MSKWSTCAGKVLKQTCKYTHKKYIKKLACRCPGRSTLSTLRFWMLKANLAEDRPTVLCESCRQSLTSSLRWDRSASPNLRPWSSARNGWIAHCCSERSKHIFLTNYLQVISNAASLPLRMYFTRWFWKLPWYCFNKCMVSL